LLFDQGQVREPLYQGKDSLLSFDTRQMCSQAQMFVATKRLVPDVLSANVEAVGLGIRVGIAIGAGQRHGYAFALVHRAPGD